MNNEKTDNQEERKYRIPRDTPEITLEERRRGFEMWKKYYPIKELEMKNNCCEIMILN